MSQLVKDVESALTLIDNGFVNEGLVKLSDYAALEPTEIAKGSEQIRRHCINWVRLQKAAVLYELAELDDARTLLESIRGELLHQNEVDEVGDGNCFCKEYIYSTIELSKTIGAQGDFKSAVNLLLELSQGLWKFHLSPQELVGQRIVALVRMYGDYLGYDSLDTRLEMVTIGFEMPKLVVESVQHWTFPIPLRGSLFLRLEEEVNDSILELDAVGDFAVLRRYELTRTLCSTLKEWADKQPDYLVARELRARFLILQAQLEIDLNEVGSFESTMEEVNVVLDELLNDFSDHCFLQLKAARWLSTLARTILFHEYDNEDLFHHYYWYGANCVATAQAVLGALEEGVEITQAVALRDCIVSNLAALGRDMITKNAEAFLLRSRRDSILNELLLRDPHNDLALRLSVDYRSSLVPRDPESEIELGSWNWSVEPLV